MRLGSRTRMACATAVAFLVIMALPALAQEGEGEGDLPPGMTPEMMAAWQEASSPGPPHAWLAKMGGKWTFTGSFLMDPDGDPTTTTGTAEREMILGGRVLVEKVHSEMMGDVFEGMGLTGYDNVSGEYWGTWNDNMGTGLMTSTGTCADDGSCEFTATWNDPMVGGPKTMRMTMQSRADGSELHVMYDKTPDGREYKSMELVYTRAE